MRHLPSLLFAVAVAVAPAAVSAQGTPLCYSISQPLGNDNFGSRSTGQTFTPGIGTVPSVGMGTALLMTQITLYQGNSGATAPSATTYLNIYDADPNAGGSFVGSSTNSVDTNGPSFRTPMTWEFTPLPLSTTTEYWAIMSSTSSAGALDVAVSLETELRNGPPGPNVYAGGAGLIANIVPHPNSLDARFEVVFSLAPPSSVTPFGVGCGGSAGVPAIGAVSPPTFDAPFTISCANVPPGMNGAFAVLGFRQFSPGIDLTPIGMRSCRLYVALDLVQQLSAVGGRADFTLMMPMSSSWVGAPLFFQFLVTDPGANSIGLIVSDAARVEIGC